MAILKTVEGNATELMGDILHVHLLHAGSGPALENPFIQVGEAVENTWSDKLLQALGASSKVDAFSIEYGFEVPDVSSADRILLAGAAGKFSFHARFTDTGQGYAQLESFRIFDGGQGEKVIFDRNKAAVPGV